MYGFHRQSDDGAAALLDFAGPSRALVTLPMQPLARSTTLVISTLMLSSLAALAFIPIDKVVTGRGIVAAPNGTLVVQPLDTSIVRAIHVEPGQLVRKGDMLAQLDPTFTGSDQSSRQEQVASLTAQIERLQAEIAGRPYAPSTQDPVHVQQAALFEERMAEHRATLARFDAETGALQAQLQRAQTDVAIGTKRLGIATDLASRRAELQRLQVGSLMNTLAANDTQAQMQQSLEEAQSAVTAGLSALEAKASEREAYARGRIAHNEADLTLLQSRLSGAQAALAKADLRQGLVSLRAQADAIVLSVARVSVGSVLQSGAELITLVPNDAHLEVEAAVSGRDVGWVRPGQAVTVKFDTLPFSRYGTAQGTVQAISPASFTERSDPAAASLPRQDSTEPYYRVRVSLDRTALHDVPEGFRVVSGMPVAADVSVGRRTVLDYLLMRVLTPLQDGMREP
ncbi:HlyD family type I secretion periplasmic adaptor subunit [Methylobacterium sp. SD274]|uniref:HlyD family type I secretion periplasmic adaptor subunit n=1 Tax=Methylobacterium sp. SD274 TaxID=2782009 RepID=UPI001A97A69C|nr:HlyD family type I secretion periplasmic adaptor subunit [Methylobacterium sp. SD274]MBO1019682.1 HlyD family type I secretion periplasmic adaptor subunit [Methylobacterium sp. SD274]